MREILEGTEVSVLTVGMIAAYAMEALSSFHLIPFHYIFVIPNPSLGIFNIITHTNIIIGYVTRNVLSIIVLVHCF